MKNEGGYASSSTFATILEGYIFQNVFYFNF